MLRPLNLIRVFVRASAQQELAYRLNFWINLLHSLLNLGVGVLGVSVLFSQVEQVKGWNYASTLALLGVYLIVGALRSLFIGPSLETLAGLGQEIATGNFDFTLLRPVNVQFLVTFREWRLWALIDLALGVGVIAASLVWFDLQLTAVNLLTFLIALLSGVVILYAVLLAFTALVFWNPAMLFTWVFDALFQLARYPVGIYPEGLRLALTWIIPVGLITTVPAQALTGDVTVIGLMGSLVLAAVLLAASSWLFRLGVRRYASASS